MAIFMLMMKFKSYTFWVLRKNKNMNKIIIILLISLIIELYADFVRFPHPNNKLTNEIEYMEALCIY